MNPLARNQTATSRTWPRRLLIGFNVFLAVVLLGGLGAYGYATWQFGKVDKISIGAALRGEGDSGSPMNVLLVGSDNRADLAPGQSKQFGSADEVGPERTDTIMVLRVDPKNQRAAILSLPRDLYVDIYNPQGGQMGRDKINAAIQGGPSQLISTVSKNFNIPIHHYMQVDFDGFRDIVGSVGGVPVRFDAPARDRLAGLDIKKAGCQVLNGDQALAYVRSRHYESYESGRWRTDPRSDLSRIDRQQDFIRRVLRTAIAKGARNPVTLNNLINAGVKNVTLDKDFELGDITRLARRFQSLDPNEVEMMTLPNTPRDIRLNGQTANVLVVKQPEAAQTVDRFVNGPPKDTSVPASSVSVRVLNGSGISGQANEAAASLKDTGFVVSGSGDAGNFASASTTIRYAKGQKSKADTLAKYVRGNVRSTEDSTLRGVDTVLVTGSNFNGIGEPGSNAPATTAPAPAPPAQPSGAPQEEC